MENITEKQKNVNRQFINLEVWRTEAEFRAISTVKGELLNEAFRRIAGIYHEKLHRIKLQILKESW